FQWSLLPTIGWSLLLPVLAIAIPYQPQCRFYPKVLFICCLMLMIAGLKVGALHDSHLVSTLPVVVAAVSLSLPVILLVVWLKVRATGEGNWHWRLLLSLPLTLFVSFLYLLPMLAWTNSYFDRDSGMAHPAAVKVKCPPDAY